MPKMWMPSLSAPSLPEGQLFSSPRNKDDRDKRGGLMDPGGTTWWISTQME
jgi:hypothetical protein